ncbi:hypothetical protein LTR27_012202 [Elasticomyces elasticus]|nr:hypothetical protein LTR27_012202 [Elasticomyces elasticus]
MSSTARVLGLPELLENTLLQLPTRDLLFAQKVCASWKTAIASSPSLQRALFFRPGSAKDIYQDSEVHIYECDATGCSSHNHRSRFTLTFRGYFMFALTNPPWAQIRKDLVFRSSYTRDLGIWRRATMTFIGGIMVLSGLCNWNLASV